jgi:hypothetical protein
MADVDRPQGSSSNGWDAALEALVRVSTSLGELSSRPDVATRLRAGLSNPTERRPTLLILGLMDTRHTAQVADQVVEAAESHRDARLARELLGRLPRKESQALIPPLVSARLEHADDDAYRRLAELLVHLDLKGALDELRARAASSDNPSVREIATDFED